MTNNNRLHWVDAAKAISIILVVMMYAAYSVGEDTGGTGVLHWIIGFATPFRMPEFFVISGLFLSQVISRPWARFADRRVVHYFYFYALWVLIHVTVKTVLGEGNPVQALSYVVSATLQPYGVLWFIYMLGVFSFIAKVLHDLRIPHLIILPIAAALQIAPIHTGAYVIDQFAEYLIYFYVGYAGAPLVFRMVEWVQSHAKSATALLGVWALLNGALVFSPGFEILPVEMNMGLAALPGLHLVLAIAGALAICTSAALLVRLPAMGWLSTLGAQSLAIYLAFTLPMSFVRILALKTGLITDPNILSLVVFGAALVSPVILYWMVQRTGFGKFLFERPQWAKIPGTNKAKIDPNQVPAE